jgi:manganese/zinc/iron transport system ATP- binding protein
MRVVASGPTPEVFTRENLQKTYGGKLNLLDDIAQALKNIGQTHPSS